MSKKELAWIPLEPHDMRYTKQWNEWFPDEFRKFGVKFQTMAPLYLGKWEPTAANFLDPTRTMIFKSKQLQIIYEDMLNNPISKNYFFADIWFPGIEGIKYISQMSEWKEDSDIYGILHAGSYDKWDRTGMLGLDKWGKHTENTIFTIAKKIFVGSEHHKQMVMRTRGVPANKIIVTNNPAAVRYIKRIRLQQLIDSCDKPIVRKNILFCGRMSIDKGLDVVNKVKKSGIKIKITRNLNLPKDDYYKMLCSSKVIFAPSRHENFGLSVIEGMAAGCIPIVPDALAFPEYVPDECRYRSEKEMYKLLRNPPELTPMELSKCIDDFDYSAVIPRMLNTMGY